MLGSESGRSQETPEDIELNHLGSPTRQNEERRILRNFFVMSVLFSSNHGTVVSCVSLATARLGSVGALQVGVMYLSYTLSALLGASYVVRRLGSRNAMIFGMALYSSYVACFVVATSSLEIERAIALSESGLRIRSTAAIAAILGGLGAGFLWVAQGTYFAQAAKLHANALSQDISDSTSYMAGIFGFIMLSTEAFLRALSSLLVYFMDWKAIFATYTAIAMVTTVAMLLVQNYPKVEEPNSPNTFLYKVTAAIRLIFRDRKMIYLVGLNAMFGFGGAFMNSYVNGEVLAVALQDYDSHYVGIFSSWTALIACLLSLCTTTFTRRKGPVVIAGILSFFFVALPFLIQPDAMEWDMSGIVTIYTLQGIGRSSFETTLKAIFADYFSSDPVGAFSNLILQNGIANSMGYFFTYHLNCEIPGKYCVLYADNSLHDVRTFPIIICISGCLALLGYWRATILFKREQEFRRSELAVSENVELSLRNATVEYI
jgi:hypothetical protein